MIDDPIPLPPLRVINERLARNQRKRRRLRTLLRLALEVDDERRQTTHDGSACSSVCPSMVTRTPREPPGADRRAPSQPAPEARATASVTVDLRTPTTVRMAPYLGLLLLPETYRSEFTHLDTTNTITSNLRLTPTERSTTR